MKVVIIGLGNFGMSLALNLANDGNEVVATDNDSEKIDLIKDHVSHAVAIDATNDEVYDALPLRNTDLVVVAIGSKEGTALMATAIVKKITDASIIARSSTKIQDTIFEAMGVDQIVHPEQEFAEQLTRKINLKGTVANFGIEGDYLVSEIDVPDKLIGKTLKESDLRSKYHLNVITVLRTKNYRNFIGKTSSKKEAIGTPHPDTIFEQNDVVVVFGKNEDIEEYLEQNNA